MGNSIEEIYKLKDIRNKIKTNYYDIEKMVKTSSNWCPNYPNDEIKISMLLYDGWEDIIVKVIAEGMDDTGVELEYTAEKTPFGYYMADRVWEQWKEYIYDKVPDTPDGIDEDWFLERGFLWS